MTGYVLDASALLAAFFGEEGTDRVEEMLPQAVIGANSSEVVAKLQDRTFRSLYWTYSIILDLLKILSLLKKMP